MSRRLAAAALCLVTTALIATSCSDDTEPAAQNSGGTSSGGNAGTAGTGGGSGAAAGASGSGATGGSASGPETCRPSGVSKGPWTLAPTTAGGRLRFEACRDGVADGVTLTPEAGGPSLEFAAAAKPFVVNETYSSLVPLTTPSDHAGTYYMHEATLTGLTAGTCYSYTLAADAELDGRFCTTAESGDFSFLAVGDTNPSLTPSFSKVYDLIAARGFDFSIHMGDIQYYDSALETWASWFPLMRPLLKNGAFMPAIGNHEFEKPDEFEQYVQRFFGGNGFDGTDRYYRFSWAGVWFFALDTEGTISDTDDTAQYDWFTSQLADAAASPGYRFSIVYYHHPFVTCGNKAQQTTERDLLEPLFEQHGVRLAMHGHMHGYERFERTLPGGAPITYVTTAGGGSGKGKPSENIDRPECATRQAVSGEFHAMLFDLKGTTLTGKAIDEGDQAIDEFSITVP